MISPGFSIAAPDHINRPPGSSLLKRHRAPRSVASLNTVARYTQTTFTPPRESIVGGVVGTRWLLVAGRSRSSPFVPVSSGRRHFFRLFLTFFNTFTSFIFHPYLIQLMFYSRPRRRLGVYSLRCFIDPLSPPSILHQPLPPFVSYLLSTSCLPPPSSSPLAISRCWSSARQKLLHYLISLTCSSSSSSSSSSFSSTPLLSTVFCVLSSLRLLRRVPRRLLTAHEPELFVVGGAPALFPFGACCVSRGCVKAHRGAAAAALLTEKNREELLCF